MKPSTLKPGAKLKVLVDGAIRPAFFIERTQPDDGIEAVNRLRFPDFCDAVFDGVCQMSDADIERYALLD